MDRWPNSFEGAELQLFVPIFVFLNSYQHFSTSSRNCHFLCGDTPFIFITANCKEFCLFLEPLTNIMHCLRTLKIRFENGHWNIFRHFNSLHLFIRPICDSDFLSFIFAKSAFQEASDFPWLTLTKRIRLIFFEWTFEKCVDCGSLDFVTEISHEF